MLVFIYLKIDAASNYHSQKVYQKLTVKKSTGGFWFDYASYWVLPIDPVLFNIIQFDWL